MRYCATAQHTLVPNAPSQRAIPLSAWFGPLYFSEAHSQVSLASNQDLMGEISRDLFGDWLQVIIQILLQSMFVSYNTV